MDEQIKTTQITHNLPLISAHFPQKSTKEYPYMGIALLNRYQLYRILGR